MASKKKDGLLGPDGQAFASAFSGLGQAWSDYMKWRAEREKRIKAKAKPKVKPKTKPESQKPGYIPASQRPSDMRKGQVYGNDSKSQGRNWSNPHGQVSNKPSEGDRSTWAKPKPKPEPKTDPPKPRNTNTRTTTTRPRTSPAPATRSNAQNLRQGRSPDKPARKPRTWLADNYKPGGPSKKNKPKKSLQIKPKKKKLTNKQRKQGGFH